MFMLLLDILAIAIFVLGVQFLSTAMAGNDLNKTYAVKLIKLFKSFK